MALPAIVPADFIGYINISADTFVQADLTSYISTFYEQFVRQILSDAAYIEVRDNSPIRTKWDDLLNGVEYTSTEDVLTINSGLVNVIRHFIYFQYMRDNGAVHTNTGNVFNLNENATQALSGQTGVLIIQRYNRAIQLLRCDVYAFVDNYETITQTATSSVDLGGGGYTLAIPSTLYLIDGDTVTIGGVDFVVSSVVVDTSFDISGASLGLDFTGDTVSYQPFEGVNRPNLLTAFA